MSLITQIASAQRPVDAEFAQFFEDLGYIVGFEGTQFPFELWHEICDEDGLFLQVKTETPLGEFLADLPYLLKRKPGIGPTDYWMACNDNAKLRKLIARVAARQKAVP